MEGLLDRVGGGVITGEGPLRLQETDQEGQGVGFVGKGLPDPEQRLHRLQSSPGEKGEAEHQDQDDPDVVPGGKIVQPRDDADPQVVEQTVGEEDQSENDQGGGLRHPVAQHRRQEAVDENGRRIVDSGHDADLADQVDPGRIPTPSLVPEQGGPVVQSARGGNRRCQFRHRRRHQQDEQGDQGPAETHHAGAAVGETVSV